MISLLAYAVIVAVAAVSYLKMSLGLFALGAGTVALGVMQLFEQRRYHPRLAESGAVEALHAMKLASVGNSFLAAFAACLLGIGTRFIFG